MHTDAQQQHSRGGRSQIQRCNQPSSAHQDMRKPLQQLCWQRSLDRISTQHRIQQRLTRFHALWEFWGSPIRVMKLAHEAEYVFTTFWVQQWHPCAELVQDAAYRPNIHLALVCGVTTLRRAVQARELHHMQVVSTLLLKRSTGSTWFAHSYVVGRQG